MDNIESIVLISGDRNAIGTGFVIHEDQDSSYVVTCAHVVDDVCNESISVNGESASIVARGRGSLDLAVLKVARLNKKTPCRLWKAADEGEVFTTSGYYYFGEPTKGNIRVAEIRGILANRSMFSTMQGIPLSGWDLVVKSDDLLESGCSGAPIFNQHNEVIAVVTHKLSDGKKGAAISVKELEKLENREVDIRPFIAVPEFKFEVVTVNAQGQIVERHDGQAEYRRENLGNNVLLEMVAIPGGSFQMGSPANELDRSDDEGPQHQVTIAPFFMGKYPVTQAQWKAVAAFPKVKLDLNPDPADFKGSDRPVECVSWWEAVEFCDRLSQKVGKQYRLPSEAEWEYACRAGTTTPSHFGKTITTDLVNYDGNYPYGDAPEGEYRQQTTPVGSFAPNSFGLYDMHGNVWEWCADHWHGNYEGAPIDGSAWLTNDEKSSRLRRGGSWYNYSGLCRSAARNNRYPDNRDGHIGFRVVCFSAWTL